MNKFVSRHVVATAGAFAFFFGLAGIQVGQLQLSGVAAAFFGAAAGAIIGYSIAILKSGAAVTPVAPYAVPPTTGSDDPPTHRHETKQQAPGVGCG